MGEDQSWEKMGDSCLKGHLHISVQAEAFIRRERGNRTRTSREGVETFSACRLAQSILIRQVMVQCASSWFSHPGFHSKVSKSLRGGMAEDQSLYLSKLVPRILIQRCCLSSSYMLVTVGFCRNNAKRMVGWVVIPHCHSQVVATGSWVW